MLVAEQIKENKTEKDNYGSRNFKKKEGRRFESAWLSRLDLDVASSIIYIYIFISIIFILYRVYIGA